MSLADQFLADAGVKSSDGAQPLTPAELLKYANAPRIDTSGVAAPVSLADQFTKDAQAATVPAAVTPKAEKSLGGFVDFLGGNLEDATAAFGHHVGNFLNGTANLAEQGLAAGANKIAPGSDATKWLRATADADQALTPAREAAYQKAVPDSPGALVGATVGTVAPFLMGGEGGLGSNVSKIGDAVGAVPKYLGAQMGKVGTAIGNVAGKIASSATQGAIYGTTAPVLDPDSANYWGHVGDSAKTGAVVGGSLSTLGQLAKVLIAGGKSAIDALAPLTNIGGGQDKKVAQFLIDNIENPDAAPAALRSAPVYVRGSEPTAAQALQDPRLLSVERTTKLTQPFSTKFDDLMRSNNAARVGVLNDMAGVDGKYDFHVADRATTANKLYGEAMDQGIDQSAITPNLKGQVTQLMQRPSMIAAMKSARLQAAEDGIKLNDNTSLQGLDYAKKALDDQISAAKRAGLDNQVRLLMGTKTKLEGVMNNLSPAYAEARATFAEMSKPINQMEEVQKLTLPLAKSATDVSGTPQLTRFQLASGLMKVNPSVMASEQMAALNSLKSDLNRADLTNTAQKQVGPGTSQDLTTMKDVVDKLLGKSNLLTRIPLVSGAAKSLTENASNAMQKKLTDVLINRNAAADAIQAQLQRNANPGLIRSLLGDPATAALIQSSPQYGAHIASQKALPSP